jgi:hypothetical protein
MNDLKALHRDAMARTDMALDARQKGDEASAMLLFREAYELEAAAAEVLANEPEAEPSRSVLFRSAATRLRLAARG